MTLPMSRYDRLERWASLLEGSPSKALVMLTATPVNNSLWDLYNLLAYFVRNDASGTLLRTDGNPSGTIELHRNLAPGALTAVGDTLYFVGTDEKHGHELWRSDGTRKGTRLVRDIRRARGRSSRPSDLTAVGKTLFFRARDDRHGTELCRAGA